MKPFLPMLDIDAQSLCHGSVNAAYTHLLSTGVQDATVTAYAAMVARWSRRPSDDTFLNDIDAMQPAVLAAAIGARLAALPELTDLSFQAGDLRKRLDILSSLRARAVSPICRSAEASAAAVADEAADRLRKSLDDAFANTPHRMREVIEQTKVALTAIQWPEPQSQPHAEFSRLVRGHDELTTRRAAFTPDNHEAIVAQLTHGAQRAYNESLKAVSLEFAVRASRQVVQDTESYLEELVSLGTQFDGRVQAIGAVLETTRTEAAAENRVSRASVIVALDGPDEREILAGMVARQRCADLQELSTDLLSRFDARLHNLAASRYPWIEPDAPLPRLVAAIDPDEAGAEFVSLVRESLGSGHTLYQVIDQYGVRQLARELIERAAHTCHLRGRDNERFNVPTVPMTILRLPQPVGAADFDIRQRLDAAFRKLGDCTVTNGSPDDKDVTVVRLDLGWPLAIEQNNPALLQRYVRSADSAHRPHLLGILDDSLGGEVSPRYRQLAETLDPTHDQED